jgi:5-formyltetrahydrofolate cyclo-ligase
LPTDRPAPASGLDAVKRALRAEASARRRAAVPGLAGGGIGLRDNFLAALSLPAGLAISAYWPLSDEMDPRPLIHHLHDAGHSIGLPAVLGRGLPLAFRRWEPDMELEIGHFGVLTPPLGAPEIVPSLLLVPLLAFDRAGYRLGYGGGFYDRTLAGLRAGTEITAVGIAFALQEVPAVPREPTDQPLDWIVTEREAIRI